MTATVPSRSCGWYRARTYCWPTHREACAHWGDGRQRPFAIGRPGGHRGVAAGSPTGRARCVSPGRPDVTTPTASGAGPQVAKPQAGARSRCSGRASQPQVPTEQEHGQEPRITDSDPPAGRFDPTAMKLSCPPSNAFSQDPPPAPDRLAVVRPGGPQGLAQPISASGTHRRGRATTSARM